MIHVTPQIMAGQYDVLRITSPYSRWALPPSDEVGFHATVPKDGAQGEYWYADDQHHIRVNPKRHTTLRSVTETLAHEMIHMRMKLLGLRYESHGPAFQRLRKIACRDHSFDLGQF